MLLRSMQHTKCKAAGGPTTTQKAKHCWGAFWFGGIKWVGEPFQGNGFIHFQCFPTWVRKSPHCHTQNCFLTIQNPRGPEGPPPRKIFKPRARFFPLHISKSEDFLAPLWSVAISSSQLLTCSKMPPPGSHVPSIKGHCVESLCKLSTDKCQNEIAFSLVFYPVVYRSLQGQKGGNSMSIRMNFC